MKGLRRFASQVVLSAMLLFTLVPQTLAEPLDVSPPMASAIELPDLTVSDLAYGFDSRVLAFLQSNIGMADISDEYLLSDSAITHVQVTNADGEVYTFDSHWGSLGYSEFLLAGGSQDVGYAFPSSYGDLVSFTICVDSLDIISESNEDNNCATYLYMPDLSVSDIYLESPYENVFTIWFDFTNKGPADTSIGELDMINTTLAIDGVDIEGGAGGLDNIEAGSTIANYAYYLLPYGNHSVEICVDTSEFGLEWVLTILGLDVGEVTNETTNIGLTPGDHTVQVCIDSSNVVPEQNEDNNCLTSEFTIPGGDDPVAGGDGVFDLSLSGPSSVNVGETASVSAIASLEPMEEGFKLDKATIDWGDGSATVF